jgi:hypothetical protein
MKKGHLDFIMSALSEISRNRLPLGAIKEIKRWVNWTQTHLTERDEVRKQFVEQYLPEGETELTPEHEGFEEAVRQINELFEEELSDLPAPINSSVFPDTIELTPEAYMNLEFLGVIKED